MDDEGVTGKQPASPAGGLPKRWLVAGAVLAVSLALGAGVYVGTRGARDADTAKDGADEVVVPDLRGMTLARAGDEVLAAGLAAGTIAYAEVEESVAPSGTVLTQDPLPGARVAAETELDIVLARGPVSATIAGVVGEVADTSGTSAPGDTSATGGDASSPPDVPPELPDLPPAESIDISAITQLRPNVLDPGVFTLIEPSYRTVVSHEAWSAVDWQSPALTFTGKRKRIVITADGPYNHPIAVWAWGPGDSDWVLKTIWFSYPGAYEDLDGTGGTWVYDFDIGAGTYTILVKLNPDVVWWKVQVQEQE